VAELDCTGATEEDWATALDETGAAGDDCLAELAGAEAAGVLSTTTVLYCVVETVVGAAGVISEADTGNEVYGTGRTGLDSTADD